jgi:hypothetical protein
MKPLKILFICLIFGIGPVSVSNAEEITIKASDPGDLLDFGISIAVSGDTLIAGGTTYRGQDGRIYIFERDKKKGDWVEVARFGTEDAATSDWFGWAVAIDGDTAVVGAWEDGGQGKDQGGGIGEGPGLVNIFTRQENEWAKQEKFNADDSKSKDRFGNAVSLSGDLLAVGAPLHDGTAEDAGAAYIFERNNDRWKQTAKLTPSDPAEKDRFGWDVAIDKDVVIVGSPLDDDAGSKSGSAYIFVRNADGSWTEQAKLKSSDLAKGDQLGNTVDITRPSVAAYAIVGAHFDDDAGDKSGSAYIFMRDQAGAWAEQKKLTASDAEKRDQFGIDVAIDVNRAIVGANQTDQAPRWADTGSAYAFLRVGTDWVEQIRVDAKNVGKGIGGDPLTGKGRDEFGYAVALEGDFALVGARYDDFDAISDAGTVYIYETKDDLGIALSVEPLSLLVTTTLGQIKRSALLQNFPNPFNPETWMPYVLATDAPVTIDIYDAKGQLVRQLNLGMQPPGSYLSRRDAAYWDGKDQLGHTVSSGLYFYTLNAGSFQATRRMVILK